MAIALARPTTDGFRLYAEVGEITYTATNWKVQWYIQPDGFTEGTAFHSSANIANSFTKNPLTVKYTASSNKIEMYSWVLNGATDVQVGVFPDATATPSGFQWDAPHLFEVVCTQNGANSDFEFFIDGAKFGSTVQAVGFNPTCPPIYQLLKRTNSTSSQVIFGFSKIYENDVLVNEWDAETTGAVAGLGRVNDTAGTDDMIMWNYPTDGSEYTTIADLSQGAPIPKQFPAATGEWRLPLGTHFSLNGITGYTVLSPANSGITFVGNDAVIPAPAAGVRPTDLYGVVIQATNGTDTENSTGFINAGFDIVWQHEGRTKAEIQNARQTGSPYPTILEHCLLPEDDANDVFSYNIISEPAVGTIIYDSYGRMVADLPDGVHTITFEVFKNRESLGTGTLTLEVGQ